MKGGESVISDKEMGCYGKAFQYHAYHPIIECISKGNSHSLAELSFSMME
jgi:hypothetical protein